MASQNRIAECMDKSAVKEREKAKKLLKQIGKLNARYVKDYEEAVSTVTQELKRKISIWYPIRKSLPNSCSLSSLSTKRN